MKGKKQIIGYELIASKLAAKLWGPNIHYMKFCKETNNIMGRIMSRSTLHSLWTDGIII
jgi:hypothetical protein